VTFLLGAPCINLLTYLLTYTDHYTSTAACCIAAMSHKKARCNNMAALKLSGIYMVL